MPGSATRPVDQHPATRFPMSFRIDADSCPSRRRDRVQIYYPTLFELDRRTRPYVSSRPLQVAKLSSPGRRGFVESGLSDGGPASRHRFQPEPVIAVICGRCRILRRGGEAREGCTERLSLP